MLRIAGGCIMLANNITTSILSLGNPSLKLTNSTGQGVGRLLEELALMGKASVACLCIDPLQ